MPAAPSTRPQQHTPDIVLLDLSIPLRAASRPPSASSARCPAPGSSPWPSAEDEDQLFEAIKAGAAAFILKDISPDDLVTIIRRVNAGEYLINDKVFARPSVASRVLKEFRELAVYGQEAAPIFAPLSPREVEILDNIAKGMTNKQVAYALSISEQTVKNHMSSILRKLSVNDRTQAVVYAMKQGWIRIPRIDDPVAGSDRPAADDTGRRSRSSGAPSGCHRGHRTAHAQLEPRARGDRACWRSRPATRPSATKGVASRARSASRSSNVTRGPTARRSARRAPQLLTLTRRAALFESQQQVLEGKQRALHALPRSAHGDRRRAAVGMGVARRRRRRRSSRPVPRRQPSPPCQA